MSDCCWLYCTWGSTPPVVKQNFSALSAVVSPLRTSVGPDNIENMMLLKLISHLIPGLVENLQHVAALKANCDAEPAASVAAQNAAGWRGYFCRKSMMRFALYYTNMMYVQYIIRVRSVLRCDFAVPVQFVMGISISR